MNSGVSITSEYDYVLALRIELRASRSRGSFNKESSERIAVVKIALPAAHCSLSYFMVSREGVEPSTR